VARKFGTIESERPYLFYVRLLAQAGFRGGQAPLQPLVALR
jgi:hypothetical protein